MLHPYALTTWGLDLSKQIEVDIHGEIKAGKPHGLCFINYIYNRELE